MGRGVMEMKERGLCFRAQATGGGGGGGGRVSQHLSS